MAQNLLTYAKPFKTLMLIQIKLFKFQRLPIQAVKTAEEARCPIILSLHTVEIKWRMLQAEVQCKLIAE